MLDERVYSGEDMDQWMQGDVVMSPSQLKGSKALNGKVELLYNQSPMLRSSILSHFKPPDASKLWWVP